MNIRLSRKIAIPVIIHLVMFLLVVGGILPRIVVPFWTIALLTWAGIVSPKISVPFFALAIPLCIAIPLTAHFDNFNMWRPLACIILLRWFFDERHRLFTRKTILEFLRNIRAHLAMIAGCCLFALALASVFQASDHLAAVQRVIYFVNAIFVPIAVFDIARQDTAWRHTVIAAIAWSAIIVTVAAFIQLISTYLMDIYGFMRFWGEGIQLRQFGTVWANIAIHMGNTWLAYYGSQLSLRVFSLFPDSHSFPIYLLMALGGVYAYALIPITSALETGLRSFRGLLTTRASLLILLFPLAFLAVILSGTRGIWAASIGLPIVIALMAWRLWAAHANPERKLLWRYLATTIVIFYGMFLVAWPIFVSPQFLIGSGDRNMLGNRLRSIIDFGETSNRARILIWKATITSIEHHPLLGVGIGNFPVVLNESIALAKAGSSAHNIWLHIASELGIPAVMICIGLYARWIFLAYKKFTRDRDWVLVVYAGWMLLALPWIAAYLLTDAALFDERALLLFGISIAIICA